MANKNFWIDIKNKTKAEARPILAMAPMADVTDCVFRELIAKYSRHVEDPEHSEGQDYLGGPDVFWTEFVSADGLMSAGREVLKRDLVFSNREHPIVAQIFGSRPENIFGASQLCAELGFDGIDINMGCPDKSIEKQGAGACMMKDAKSARAVIRAAIEGGGGLPVSIKTRIGYNKIEYKTFLAEILQEDIKAITIHLRTRKEMSLVEAHWELMPEILEFIKNIRPDIVVLGNGDVKDIADGYKKYKDTNVDGVMIGRGIFGKPWLFDRARTSEPTLEKKLKILVEHTKNYEKGLGDIKSFMIMKKHYKAYVNGFDGAKELREKLMLADSAEEVENIVVDFLRSSTS